MLLYSLVYLIFVVFCFSRVHITQATLDYLGGEYEVEAGVGPTRNQYLRDHCVTTYFIVPPARRRKVLDANLAFHLERYDGTVLQKYIYKCPKIWLRLRFHNLVILAYTKLHFCFKRFWN